MRRLASLAAILVLAAGCGQAPAATSPSPSPPASVSGTPRPADSALDRRVVYFARDRLPPIARSVPQAGTGQHEANRIHSRLAELQKASPKQAGEANLLLSAKAKIQGVSVNGDLASVDYLVPGDDWGVSGSAAVKGLVQQIVYTASEEPGIRRVHITQNAGKRAVIGGEGLVIDGPRTREDVAGYQVRAGLDAFEEPGDAKAQLGLVHRWSIDDVAPALARVVVETDLKPTGQAGLTPSIKASLRQNDERAAPLFGKWVLTLDIANAKPSYAGMSVTGTKGVVVVDRTPLRAIHVQPEGNGVRYELALDDRRPWRVGLLSDPVRVVMDVGGDPDALAGATAVYTPRFGVSVQTIFSLTGMARAFEANVLWRVKDPQGQVTAQGTTNATIGTSPVWGGFDTKVILPTTARGAYELEVYQSSPQDGQDTDLVRIPLVVR